MLQKLSIVLVVLSLTLVGFTVHRELQRPVDVEYYTKAGFFMGCYTGGMLVTNGQLPQEMLQQGCLQLKSEMDFKKMIEFIAQYRENTNGEF